MEPTALLKKIDEYKAVMNITKPTALWANSRP